ncbi:MAG: hypothetical protein IPL26_17900 [Leptospiraceae bacterium]|nr:hypothetical protein [Leptospiraceae bacterium]
MTTLTEISRHQRRENFSNEPFDFSDDVFTKDAVNHNYTHKVNINNPENTIHMAYQKELGIYMALSDGLSSFQEYIANLNESFFEDKIGMFPPESIEINFFKDKNAEKILDEIRRKNELDGAGNVKIPGTDIEFINYSYCPKCAKVYSFSDLIKYYNKPVPNINFRIRGQQLREDTSVCCSECNTYFLPALVVIDGEPKTSMQFLCRMQTINEVERFYFQKWQRKVLSKNKANLIVQEKKQYILNDVLLRELAENPTLILNLLQYSPIDLRIKMIEGKNIEERDYLFQSVRYFPI